MQAVSTSQSNALLWSRASPRRPKVTGTRQVPSGTPLLHYSDIGEAFPETGSQEICPPVSHFSAVATCAVALFPYYVLYDAHSMQAQHVAASKSKLCLNYHAPLEHKKREMRDCLG